MNNDNKIKEVHKFFYSNNQHDVAFTLAANDPNFRNLRRTIETPDGPREYTEWKHGADVTSNWNDAVLVFETFDTHDNVLKLVRIKRKK